jgi:hypothetical protein
MIQTLQQDRMYALLVENKIRRGTILVRRVNGPFGVAAMTAEALKAERHLPERPELCKTYAARRPRLPSSCRW